MQRPRMSPCLPSAMTLAVLSLIAAGPSRSPVPPPAMAPGDEVITRLNECDASADSGGIIRTTWGQPRTLPAASSEGGVAGAPTATFLNTGSGIEGDAPDEVVYTPDGNSVVVVHRDTDNVTFIDVNSRSVTHTVTVGDFPLDVAVTPDGQKAVVANALSHTVSIIDIASHTVAATVPVGGQQPFAVALTPDSQFAVVALINDAVNSAFSVINLASGVESHVIPTTSQGVIGGFFTPESGISGPILTQFALTPDGNTIVLPHRAGAAVKLYSRASGALLNSLPVAAGPTAVDISDDGTTAVIAHSSPGNAVSEIDLITHAVTGSFPTPVLDPVIRITPDKSHAIAAISNNVIFVDLATGATAATIMTGVVGDIEISFNGQYAFVSNFNARVIDIASRTLVATVPFAACVESACSPTQLRAVALNSRFREDIHFYGINGAAAALEGFALTGPPPEGDAARDLALSANGDRLIVCHNTSRNIAVVDPESATVLAHVDVGDRPLGAAITPDGQYALVCATDAHVVRVIDMATLTTVASLTINQRPVHVRISPDSQWAYVLNVAGVDQLSFIQLNGASSSIVTQVSMGLQAGSAAGYAYTETSGMEISPNGALVAVCDSFNDFLRLYDTTTRTQIAQVPVGDFPIRVAFNPAGTRAFVTNAFGDSVSIVNVNGASSSVIGTVTGIEFPLTVVVDDAGSFAYVGNTDGGNPRIHVISASTNAQVATVSLSDPARETALDPATDILYAALNDGTLARINAAGAASSMMDSTTLSAGPSDMVFDPIAQRAITAQPIPDGIDIVNFGDTCPADIVGGDGVVNIDDLLAVVAAWGACPTPPTPCPANIVTTGASADVVDIDDLLAVISAWGVCP